MYIFGPKWTGPIYVAAGVLLLVYQSYLFSTLGYIHTWLLGGGVGLMLVGGVAWFYYFDDKRTDFSQNEELPTADEYDELLDAKDHVDQDHES